jgi:hypothetical protein
VQTAVDVHRAERGLLRLRLRKYQVFAETLAPSRQTVWNGQERLPPIKGSPQEQRMRLKQAIIVGIRAYIKTPSAVPNCPCMIHRLGVPQAGEIFEHLPPARNERV